MNDEALESIVAFLALLHGLRMVLIVPPGRPARGPMAHRGIHTGRLPMLETTEGSTVAGGALSHDRYQPSMPWLATPAGGQFSSFMPRDRPR